MSNGKILIVDDEPAARLAMEILLKHAGYETVAAADGLSAVHQTEKEHPDLVLLDLNIPGGNGFLVLEWLRVAGSKIGSQTPVIVLTGADYQSNETRALKAGAQAFVQKPYSFPELLKLIQVHQLRLEAR